MSSSHLTHLGDSSFTYNMMELAGKSEEFFSQDLYLQSRAEDKMNYLWSEITQDSNSGNFPSSLAFAGIFAESMEPTFSTKGDAMEVGSFGLRTKYIHSVGTVGKVSLKSNGNHPFTGIFEDA